MSTPAVLVVSFELTDDDSSLVFAEVGETVRHALKLSLPDRPFIVYVAIDAAARDITAITDSWHRPGDGLDTRSEPEEPS